MIFDDLDSDVREKYLELWYALDGTQKCADDPDMYTANWTSRNIPEEVARDLCAGCPFLEQCRDYAVTAKEEHGIWGGTTPEMRKNYGSKD